MSVPLIREAFTVHRQPLRQRVAFDAGLHRTGGGSGLDQIVGSSPPMREAIRLVQLVANTDATVLLRGETGTGKELFARALHDSSTRRGQPLVAVNCAALPPTLIEAELFGHERGAFTGALAARQGRFELADRGTLFLDEIGDLPLELQGRLLRVLQEGEFERLGSSRTRSIDVRVVVATHRDLEAAVREGRFRADLYYRLSVFPIVLPPLRARRDDIPLLVWSFIRHRQRALNRHFSEVPPEVMRALQDHDWPGNVRELHNVVERAMILARGPVLTLDVPGGTAQESAVSPEIDGAGKAETRGLRAWERDHILRVLVETGWRVRGPRGAAAVLDVKPTTLEKRMARLGIRRPSAALWHSG